MITNELYDLIHAGDLQGSMNWLDRRPDDLNADISDGYTPLHVACLFGQEAIVQHLLDRRGLVNVNANNMSQATPLHAAVMFRDEAIADRVVRSLLANGAELNATQNGGQTPLHHAVARGSLVLVKTLIEFGADPFLKDEQGRSAQDLAQQLLNSAEGNSSRAAIREAMKAAFSLPLETR